MAFNDVGRMSIGAGATFRVFVSLGAADRGAQWIMAHSIGPGFLQVDNQAKERRIRVPNTLDTYYWCNVLNIGGEPTIFSIQGGGNA